MTHVVLIGFMGCGKSVVGRRLARRLGFGFVDLDHHIESSAGRSVADIFADDGEAAFRRLERDAVAALDGELSASGPTVVATGGGTFVDADNRRALHALGVVVCLVISLETVLDRVSGSPHRPLASGPGARERLERLYDERMPIYREADVLVETDHLTIDQAVSRVAAMIQPRLKAAPRRAGGAT